LGAASEILKSHAATADQYGMNHYTPAHHRKALDRILHDMRKIGANPPREPEWCQKCRDRPARVHGFCEQCCPDDPDWGESDVSRNSG
jgi:hypothetical protein